MFVSNVWHVRLPFMWQNIHFGTKNQQTSRNGNVGYIFIYDLQSYQYIFEINETTPVNWGNDYVGTHEF